MKKKNTNIENTSNRDILKNKIIQLHEAVFVKKMDLKISIFIPPLLWIGIPLLGEIISFFIITKYQFIAYCLIILSFAAQIGYVFFGVITTLITLKKSYKPFPKYIADDFITQLDIQKNVNNIIKDIEKESLQKYIAFLSNKIIKKEKRNTFIYKGTEAMSLFALVMLFIKNSKNIYELIVNNTTLDIIQFLIYLIPLLFSISFYLDRKEIEKCETILSYLPKDLIIEQ